MGVCARRIASAASRALRAVLVSYLAPATKTLGLVPFLLLLSMPFVQAISHGQNTLISLWKDIGACVAKAGVRKLVLYNSHGGQMSVMDIVARDLRERAIAFGAVAISRHRDRELVKAVIARAKAQGRGEMP